MMNGDQLSVKCYGFRGFDSFKIVVPYGKIKHQCGNSVAVPVIKAVAEKMVSALENS